MHRIIFYPVSPIIVSILLIFIFLTGAINTAGAGTGGSIHDNADHGQNAHKNIPPDSHAPMDSTVNTGHTVTLDQITVVSKKIDDYIMKNPGQVVSMDENEIILRNFIEVYEALGSMAGVDVRRGSSGMGARISIRGGGGSGSVLILMDGRPMNSGAIRRGGSGKYPH